MNWLLAALEKNPVLAIILAISVGVGILLGGTVAFATKGQLALVSQQVDEFKDKSKDLEAELHEMDKKLDIILMQRRR